MMENNILIEQMTSKDIDGVFEVEKNCFEHHWSKDAFKKELASRYDLPLNYLQARILGFPMQNMMNKLQQEVLMLYTYDENPDDISPEATLNKGLDLIAKIPEIVCYAYRTKVHYFDSDSWFIHPVNTEYSIAENILQMLRIDRSFTKI